jgi:hypothetical protein
MHLTTPTDFSIFLHADGRVHLHTDSDEDTPVALTVAQAAEVLELDLCPCTGDVVCEYDAPYMTMGGPDVTTGFTLVSIDRYFEELDQYDRATLYGAYLERVAVPA